jgi:dolichol-phosphate mannosyltransferase
MTSATRTLIIVATYNEIENLPQLVAGIHQHLPDGSILVIDDNSPDGTGRWCDEQAAADPRFHVIHRPGKLGLGSATVAGLQFAIDHDFTWAVTMDADLSHDPQHLPAILAAAEDPEHPADLVIGSRYVPGGHIEGWRLHRHVMSRFINTYARWLLRLEPRDCSGAYRCFRVELLRKIDFAQLTSQGYALLEELLWTVQRHGARIREVPITFVDRRHGQTKIDYREAWMAVWVIFRLAVHR